MKDALTKLLKIIPFLGGIVIFISVIKAIFYYRLFGVRILSYLEVSELLFLFLDDVIFIAIATCITLILSINTIANNRKKIAEARARIEQHLQSDKIEDSQIAEIVTQEFKPFRKRIFRIQMLVLIMLAIPTVLIRFFNPTHSQKAALIIFISFFIFIILGGFISNFLAKKASKIFRLKDSQTLENIMTGVYFYFTFLLLSSVIDFYFIKYYGIRDVTLVKLSSGEVINTSKNLAVIGSTKNFVFILDSKTKAKRVLKMDNVNELILK